jgi:hypothetical protein
MSTSTHAPLRPDEFPRFLGGRTAMLAFALIGVAGLALTALGFVGAPQPTLLSYLVAFMYWLGIALGALVLLMANHAAGARWNIVVRRLNEAIVATTPIYLLLFLPILLGARVIFSWVAPDAAAFGAEGMKLLQHKHAYLNMGSFTLRAAVYFAIWIATAGLMRGWSLKQDQDGEAEWTRKLRRLGAGGLPFIAFSLTFASFDWLMSLNPLWGSTIFGLYIFAGGFVAAIALLCIITALVIRSHEPVGALITESHLHNLGKYLLAFIAFWAYMAFSQYMLIWVGNLPDEVPWILLRREGGWRWVGVFLIIFHFVVPFLLLLSRDLKRNPRTLAAIAGWVMLVHYVDLYWIVLPVAHAGFHWTALTSFAGVGGLSVAFGLWRLRGGYAVPVRDPYLEDSLRYVQP